PSAEIVVHLVVAVGDELTAVHGIDADAIAIGRVVVEQHDGGGCVVASAPQAKKPAGSGARSPEGAQLLHPAVEAERHAVDAQVVVRLVVAVGDELAAVDGADAGHNRTVRLNARTSAPTRCRHDPWLAPAVREDKARLHLTEEACRRSL